MMEIPITVQRTKLKHFSTSVCHVNETAASKTLAHEKKLVQHKILNKLVGEVRPKPNKRANPAEEQILSANMQQPIKPCIFDE